MDISFIAEHLWIASSFYPIDEEMPPRPVVLDCTLDIEDAELTERGKWAVREVAEYAQIMRSEGYNVVLQCKAGRNRSALIAALCLIADGMNPTDAIMQIRAARTSLARSGGALTNPDFVRFVLESGNAGA